MKVGLRNLYIFPSRAGGVMCLVLGGIITGGANYDNNLIYALAFLGFGLLLAAMLQTYVQLFGLELEWLPPAPVYAREQAHFPLRVWVAGRTPRRSLELAWRPARRRRAEAPPPTQATGADVFPGATHLGLSIPTARRGFLRLAPGRVRVATFFPLGLFRAWCHLPPAPPCLVYPRPDGDALPAPHARSRKAGGATAAREQGSEDFLGFSNYRPGDPIRRIAWHAVARGEELLVKRFGATEHDEQPQLWFRWSELAQLPGDEARLAQLCRWILDAETARLRYGLRLPGFEAPPGRGPLHQEHCLRALALFPNGAATP